MGKKKKVEKSIKSFEKQIKKHKEKLRKYIEEKGIDYALIEYWKKEIRLLENQKDKKITKVKKLKETKNS